MTVHATEPNESAEVDVVQVMDHAPFRGLPLLVSILTLFAMVFDGFDIQVVAFAAPKLLEEWGLTRPGLVPILAAGLVGMAVGAFLLGMVGDRYGRRIALIGSLIIVAVMSLGAAYSNGVSELAAWRFATGIGLGGVVPNCTAMMIEFAPLSVRAVIVALTVVGVPIGGLLGSEVARLVLPLFGWRGVFVIGAILPAALVAVLLFALPESPRFLAARRARAADLARLLNRVSQSSKFTPDQRFTVLEAAPSGAKQGLATLFGPELRRDTLLIWLIFVTNIFAVFAFFNWLPVVLSSVGLPLDIALRGASMFNVGGVVASLLLAMVMARIGSRATLIGVGIGAVLTTLAIGFVPVSAASAGAPASGVGLVLALIALAGGFILAMQVCMYSVAAHAYPTTSRSTGVGWASSFARFGGILSTFAGSILLAMGQGMRPFFVGVALVLVLTLLGVILLRRHMPPTH
jgi:AAHS family 4-hydroxybenzoate transporter-like MFS transporter